VLQKGLDFLALQQGGQNS